MTKTAPPGPPEPEDRDASLKPHERLAIARLRAGFATATDAARAFGWNENTYRSHENGERGIKLKVAEKYSGAFNVSDAYILYGDDYDDNVYQQFNGRAQIPISGHMKYSGLVEIMSRDISIADADFFAFTYVSFLPNIIAIEVIEEDTVGFLSKGDLIIVNKKPEKLGDAVGRLCLIGVDDHTAYLRAVRLASNPEQVDVQTSMLRGERAYTPEWIWAVHAVIFRGQWWKEPRSEWAKRGLDSE